MYFASPFWLLALLPWLALSALLLLGRRRHTHVPFLELWRNNMPDQTVRRRFSTPPIGVLLVLLALLLVIFAAASPANRITGSGRLLVIVDTGSSMSAQGSAGLRFQDELRRLAKLLQEDHRDDIELDLIVVPGGAARRASLAELSALSLEQSALDTSAELVRVVREKSAEDAPLVVLSDRSIGDVGSRVVQIAPDRAVSDVGISLFQIRRSPQAAAMVRVYRSPGGNLPARLFVQVRTGGTKVEQSAELGPERLSADLHFDLPAVGGTATAEILNAKDDFPANDRADLVADVDWPLIQPTEPVGDLSRLVDLYAARRPPGERSVHVRLVTSESILGAGTPGVILAGLGGATAVAHATVVASHPVLASAVDWSKVELPAIATRPKLEGWTTILADISGPLVAIRESIIDAISGKAVRQVWSALDAGTWSNRPEYVVFWSAVFDWVGHSEEAGDRLTRRPLVELDGDWKPVDRATESGTSRIWPGIYERKQDSMKRAFGLASTPVSTPAFVGDGKAALAELLKQGDHEVRWTPWLVVAVIALLSVAAGVWRGGMVRDQFIGESGA